MRRTTSRSRNGGHRSGRHRSGRHRNGAHYAGARRVVALGDPDSMGTGSPGTSLPGTATLSPQDGARVIGGTAQGTVDPRTWMDDNWWWLTGIAAIAGVTLFFVIRKQS